LSPARQTWHEGIRQLTREGMEREWRAAYKKVLTRDRPFAVMAEYADTALLLMDVCHDLDLPLIVHFHGRDASHKEVIEAQRGKCQRLLAQAAAIVAVSRAMKQRLVGLGASPERVFVNPCGVDCEAFSGGAPEHAPALFVAVGRFVDKKCP